MLCLASKQFDAGAERLVSSNSNANAAASPAATAPNARDRPDIGALARQASSMRMRSPSMHTGSGAATTARLAQQGTERRGL